MQKQTDGVTVPASRFTKPTQGMEVSAEAPSFLQVNASRHAVASSSAIHPFIITRRGLNVLFASPTLVRLMIKAGWIALVRSGKPGREALYDFASAQLANERLKRGEEPVAQDEGGHHA